MISLLHTALVVIAVVLFLIIGIPVSALTWLVGKFNPDKREEMNFRWVQSGFRMVMFLTGGSVKVIGLENIPKDRAVLFVSNHRSFFDTVIPGSHLPNRTAFVAKKETEKVPLLRDWMKRIHCFFLDREDIKNGVEMIDHTVSLIKSGVSVFICPEGTRNRREGTLLDFHGGSFKIAIRSGAPIIPVTQVFTGDILEDHFPKIKPAHVTIVYGEPIETAGIPIAQRKQIPDKCREIIETTYQKYAAESRISGAEK